MDLDVLYRLLRGPRVQAQGIVDTIRDPLLVLGPDLAVISANPAFYSTFDIGPDATIGVSFFDLGSGQWDIDELRVLLEKVIPRSASIIDYEVRANFPGAGERTMLVSAQRLAHPDGGRRVLLLTIVDATERRFNEDEKDVLIGELDHRVKNLLSVTQALVRQAETTGRTAEQFRDAVVGRLEALGRSLQISALKRPTELAELVRSVMEPYARATIADAPAVSLGRGQASALSMILHELATNAMKHGALSTPGGRVSIDWTVDPDADDTSRIHLRWQESGGPATSPPASIGFGTRLIRFAAEHDLDGRTELNYRPEGLVATVTFPRR